MIDIEWGVDTRSGDVVKVDSPAAFRAIDSRGIAYVRMNPFMPWMIVTRRDEETARAA